jgi:hypothetical protein
MIKFLCILAAWALVTGVTIPDHTSTDSHVSSTAGR